MLNKTYLEILIFIEYTMKFIVIVLSTLLTLFSIFFNYDENIPVKLSKYGRWAIFIALVLAVSSIFLEYNEITEAKLEKIITDSIRNQLIIKNDSVTNLIHDFKEGAFADLSLINDNVLNNLTQLSEVNDEVTLKIKDVNKELQKTQRRLSNEIYESNYPTPDKINIQLVLGLSESYAKKERLFTPNSYSNQSYSNGQTGLTHYQDSEGFIWTSSKSDTLSNIFDYLHFEVLFTDQNGSIISYQGFGDFYSRYFINDDKSIYIAPFSIELNRNWMRKSNTTSIYDFCRADQIYIILTEMRNPEKKEFDILIPQIDKLIFKSHYRHLTLEPTKLIHQVNQLQNNRLNPKRYASVTKIEKCWEG